MASCLPAAWPGLLGLNERDPCIARRVPWGAGLTDRPPDQAADDVDGSDATADEKPPPDRIQRIIPNPALDRPALRLHDILREREASAHDRGMHEDQRKKLRPTPAE